MNNIPQRLEQIVSSTQRRLIEQNQILPEKVEHGILVGNVLIVNEGTVKNLWKNNDLIYKDVHLNAVAIKLANMLARNQSRIRADEIYKIDQDYGRWFVDSQLLRSQFQKALANHDHYRADIFWARYCESRDKALRAKNQAQGLTQI
ncbi:MAG: hypothetical protein ABFD07_05230 [Methanobacterium sp.]